MRLWAGRSTHFVQDATHNQIAEKLKGAFFQHYRYPPPPSEVAAWRNSLRATAPPPRRVRRPRAPPRSPAGARRAHVPEGRGPHETAAEHARRVPASAPARAPHVLQRIADGTADVRVDVVRAGRRPHRAPGLRRHVERRPARRCRGHAARVPGSAGRAADPTARGGGAGGDGRVAIGAPRLHGNRLSNIFTSLCTDVDDPIVRLQAIRDVMKTAKESTRSSAATCSRRGSSTRRPD
jgi:hypothetical protein